VDNEAIESALAAVVVHHDALRLRYSFGEETGPRQFHSTEASPPPLIEVDLSELPLAGREAAMRARATELHQTLDLERGPLMQCVRFDQGPEQPTRLLWIVHHLLVDIVSWQVLSEDFFTALHQLRDGRPLALPPKTSSYKEWATGLADYAQSDSLREELGSWWALSRTALPTLPLDSAGGANDFQSARTLSGKLDEDETQALLRQVPAVSDTRVDEVLLTALAQAFSRWTRSSGLLVDLEGHGREGIVKGLDLSRTVGWFTSVFPILLEVRQVDGPGEALKSVKQQHRRVPRHGIGYGLARYLTRDPKITMRMRALPRPEVNFLYLGHVDSASRSSRMRLMQESSGLPCHPEAPRQHLLEVLALVSGGRLRIDFTYSVNCHRTETIDRLIGVFMEALRKLIEYCRSADAAGFTPSDFPAAQVSQRDLDTLITQLGQPEKSPGDG
jgi:non-ribosomal peptide synthase protein (TIGR01720 family)